MKILSLSTYAVFTAMALSCSGFALGRPSQTVTPVVDCLIGPDKYLYPVGNAEVTNLVWSVIVEKVVSRASDTVQTSKLRAKLKLTKRFDKALAGIIATVREEILYEAPLTQALSLNEQSDGNRQLSHEALSIDFRKSSFSPRKEQTSVSREVEVAGMQQPLSADRVTVEVRPAALGLAFPEQHGTCSLDPALLKELSWAND